VEGSRGESSITTRIAPHVICQQRVPVLPEAREKREDLCVRQMLEHILANDQICVRQVLFDEVSKLEPYALA
jgi:hypothetical protein